MNTFKRVGRASALSTILFFAGLCPAYAPVWQSFQGAQDFFDCAEDGSVAVLARGTLVYVYDGATIREIRRFAALAPIQSPAGLAPDGSRLACFSEQFGPMFIDLQTGRTVRGGPPEPRARYRSWFAQSVGFSGDSSRVAFLTNRGELIRYDAASGRRLGVALAADTLDDAVFSPDLATCYGLSGGRLRRYSMTDGSRLEEMPIAPIPFGRRLQPDWWSGKLACFDPGSGQAAVFDLASGTWTRHFWTYGSRMRFMAGGRELVVCDAFSIRRVDTSTGAHKTLYSDADARIESWAFDRTRSVMVAPDQGLGVVHVADFGSNHVVSRAGTNDYGPVARRGGLFVSLGQRLVLSNAYDGSDPRAFFAPFSTDSAAEKYADLLADGSVCAYFYERLSDVVVFDLRLGYGRKFFPPRQGSLSVANLNRRLFVAGSSVLGSDLDNPGVFEREDSATGPYVRTATTVPVVASSPWAGGIYVGDYTTQNPPTLLPGSEGYWVKFLTEDGQYLLGATSKRLRCWKLPEGRLISEMRMPEGYNSVSCAALTPDGSRTVVTTQVPTRTLAVYDTFLGARLRWEPMDPRFAIKWLEPGTEARTLAFGRNDGISGLAQF